MSAATAPPASPPEQKRRPQLAALINCGFPEAGHIAPAMAITAQLAREAGFTWSGGLALGAGEGLVHGMPLASVGRAAHVRAALDLAADALARGLPIPDRAGDLLARPFVAPRLYRAIGDIGWHLEARRWGVARQLGRRPYAGEPGGTGRVARGP